jgi:hypothetical protein
MAELGWLDFDPLFTLVSPESGRHNDRIPLGQYRNLNPYNDLHKEKVTQSSKPRTPASADPTVADLLVRKIILTIAIAVHIRSTAVQATAKGIGVT